MTKQISLAVRALVEHMSRSGDLVLDFFGAGRQVEGTLAHQLVQDKRPKEYQREVTISLAVERGDYLIDIGGRIDGVFRYPNRIIIEEIKSTTKSLKSIEEAGKIKSTSPGHGTGADQPRDTATNKIEHTPGNDRHWGQLKIYCYIFALQENLETVDARLTYYQVNTEESLEIDREFSFAELETFIYSLIDRFINWSDALEKWQGLRNDTAEKLEFPFRKYRPGQRKMALGIYHTIEANDQLIVQAPTGIGKTMAALFPAIKAMGRELCGKIFYLTARTTGKTVAEKALQELREKGLRFRALTLTAKERACFSPDCACNGEECEFAKGYYDRVDAAIDEILQQDALTRTLVETMARKHRVCPFEYSLELALSADCIICDYNYVFDPFVYLKRFFPEENENIDYVFLVDEAHNLVDRAREMFSAELEKNQFLELRRTIKNKLPDIYKSLGKINDKLREYRKRCDEDAAGEAIAGEKEPEDIYGYARRFTSVTEDWLAQNIKTPYREDVLELYFSVSRFLKTAEQYDQTYATLYQPLGRNLKLKLYNIDPSRQLEEALLRCKAVIFFSATMTPTTYFRKILGCYETAGATVLPSPFPPENLCLLVHDRISTLYRKREQTKTAVSRLLSSMVKQKKGNYLLFFPSYRYMTMVHEIFSAGNGVNDGMEIIIQSPGMTESERDLFLHNFDKNREDGGSLVGFAVMGGVFGEGIDLVGDRLTGAVIVGVGLPAICLERNLIRNYFLDLGFEYAYLYPGINRVLQAAGRVIRSEEDHGIILLVDERFSWNQYKTLFPQEWRPIRVTSEDELTTSLDHFWKHTAYASINHT